MNAIVFLIILLVRNERSLNIFSISCVNLVFDIYTPQRSDHDSNQMIIKFSSCLNAKFNIFYSCLIE